MDLPSFSFGFLTGVLVVFGFLIVLRILLPWRRAFGCRARVSLFNILGMLMRGNSPDLLVDALIYLVQVQGRDDISIQQIERYYITKGDSSMNAAAIAELAEHEADKETQTV
ncbi:SigmaW regulon antibacterial [Gimesia panareensis]|uniref:SigmaW regulon antibacterial n=1 Tax=Gimesia panareensis TaxID=2527978 RepID=A0A517Q1G3_9PLAN|nr:hypothetical protein [Gimesia panareensis]QDT25464.1 SigmaW regulon antibacterial [Gimesia panareensis]